MQFRIGLNNLIIALIFVICSGHSMAFDKVTVLTASWANYTNSDGSGLYFDILNLVLRKDQYDFKLVPWKRAQESFSSGRSGDLLLGEAGGMDYCRYPKWALDADFFSAFYLNGNLPSMASQAELAKHKLVWVRGYEIGKFAPSLKAYQEVDNMEQGVKMVKGGRADVLIDYDQDLKDYIKATKLDPKEHLVSSTDISGGLIYLCFKKDKKYDGLMKAFDQKMEKAFLNGSLKKIFEKHNRLKNYEKVIRER